jgi:hypothetical protein
MFGKTPSLRLCKAMSEVNKTCKGAHTSPTGVRRGRCVEKDYISSSSNCYVRLAKSFVLFFDFAGSLLDALPVTNISLVGSKHAEQTIEKPAMVQRGWCFVGGSRNAVGLTQDVDIQRLCTFLFPRGLVLQ